MSLVLSRVSPVSPPPQQGSRWRLFVHHTQEIDGKERRGNKQQEIDGTPPRYASEKVGGNQSKVGLSGDSRNITLMNEHQRGTPDVLSSARYHLISRSEDIGQVFFLDNTKAFSSSGALISRSLQLSRGAAPGGGEDGVI